MEINTQLKYGDLVNYWVNYHTIFSRVFSLSDRTKTLSGLYPITSLVAYTLSKTSLTDHLDDS